MAREPSRRYGSVAELIADLWHFLNHEPVLAGPPGKSYQLQKFVRRHRVLLGATTAVVAALVLGFLQARAEARSARREARKANSISAFLEKTLTSAGHLERGPEARVVDVLEETAPMIRTELADMPEARAMVEYVVGKSFLGLFRLEEAEEHLDQAWRYAEASLPREHPLRIATFAVRARLIVVRGNPEAAEPLLREAEECALRHLGPEDETTLLVQGTLAELLIFLGSGEAGDRFDALLPRLVERLGPQHGEVIAARGGRALVWRMQGRLAEACEEFERVLTLAQEALPPGHFRIFNAMNNLAGALLEQGEVERAQDLARRCLARVEELFGGGHPLALAANILMVDVLRTKGQPEQTVPFLERALEILVSTDEGGLTTAQIRVELAQTHLSLGDRTSAEPLLTAVLERCDADSELARTARDLLARNE